MSRIPSSSTLKGVEAVPKIWFDLWSWSLLGLIYAFGLWLIVLVFSWSLSSIPPDRYTLGRIERISSRVPLWISRLTAKDLPWPTLAGRNLTWIDRRFSRELRAADRASRALFALPTLVTYVMGALGIAQVILVTVLLLVYSLSLFAWDMLSIAVCIATFATFSFTAGVRELVWRLRAPFEWMYLRATYWSVRNARGLQDAGGSRPDARVIAEYLDSAEQALTGRFRGRDIVASASLHYAAVEWRTDIDSLLRKKGRFILKNRGQDPVPFVLDWLEAGAEVIRSSRRFRSRIRPKASDARREHRFATTRPERVSGLLRVTVWLLALAALFACFFVAARMQEGGSHPHLVDMVAVVAPVLNGLEAVAAILVAFVSIYSLVAARKGVR